MRRSIAAVVCLISLLLTSCIPAAEKDAEYKSYGEFIFPDNGGYPAIYFEFSAYGGNHGDAFDRMLVVLDELNSQVNVNLTKPSVMSDAARLNAAKSGEEVEIGAHMYALADAAKRIYADTDKKFNAAIYPLTELWGVDANGLDDSDVKLPEYGAIQAMLPDCDMDKLHIYDKDGKYFAKKDSDGLKVDFGGIAKGYAADLCADICKEYGVESAIFTLSGNLYCYGPLYEKVGKSEKWRVGVTNPNHWAQNEPQHICALNVEGTASLVTSGDYERRRRFGDLQVCHIIGSDGLPLGVIRSDESYVNTDDHVVSCTVIAESSMLCDAYATAVCLMGIKDGAAFLAEKGVDGLIFTKDGKRATIGEIDFIEGDSYNKYLSYEEIKI